MTDIELKKYSKIIIDYAKSSYKKMFRNKGGNLNHNFIVPGPCYNQELWDWDSWLTDIALREIAEEDISDYEKGCVLNFLENVQPDGWTPVVIMPDKMMPPFDERDIIDRHAYLSYRILTKLGVQEELALICLYHHGTNKPGYRIVPMWEGDDKVFKYAKMLETIDIYEAITTDRPYHRRKSSMDAIEIIKGLDNQSKKVIDYLSKPGFAKMY